MRNKTTVARWENWSGEGLEHRAQRMVHPYKTLHRCGNPVLEVKEPLKVKPLEGKVAVVAGATRGAGRGIARMLGEAGATVSCTGRNVCGRPATLGRPETIEETAEMVTAAGGVGVPVQVGHMSEEQVRTLFERIRREQERLDVLVNDIWGGEDLIEWGKPFWELDPEKGLRLLQLAIHTSLQADMECH